MKKFVTVLLIVLCLGALVLDGLYFYYKSIEYEVYAQQTIHSGGTLKTDKNADKNNTDFVLEFVYYANKDKSGAEMLEFQLKCFSGVNCDSVAGYGMQIINPANMSCSLVYDKDTSHIENIIGTRVDRYWLYNVQYGSSNVSYFNTDDFVSFAAVTALNEEAHPYIIKIEDKPYSFDFNFDDCYLEKEILWGLSHSYYHYVSTFDFFIYKTYTAILDLHNKDGKTEGVYKNLTMEYANVFNFYSEKNGRFQELSNYTYSSKYMDLKVTYIDRGAKVHTDSKFGKIYVNKDKTEGVIYA